MSYKIVVDSCGELTEEMKRSGYYETASLSIDIDEHHIVDDETFDQKRFLALIAQSPNSPKSSCPSPETYMAGYRCEAERVCRLSSAAPTTAPCWGKICTMKNTERRISMSLTPGLPPLERR